VKRSAAASFALAAAGMLYSRLGGRRRPAEPAEEAERSGEQPTSSAEVDRARSELADELRRRASRPPADG
jgi:hypothetical protein